MVYATPVHGRHRESINKYNYCQIKTEVLAPYDVIVGKCILFDAENGEKG